jgi:hypothetical protein
MNGGWTGNTSSIANHSGYLGYCFLLCTRWKPTLALYICSNNPHAFTQVLSAYQAGTLVYRLEDIISKHAWSVDGYSVQRLVGKASDVAIQAVRCM